jgi:hypothetical protein
MGIFVIGMHRSGTSLVAGLLHAMGARAGEPDELLGPDAFNPAGYWERVDVFHLHERMLAAAGSAWDRVAGFDIARIPAGELDHFPAEAGRILGVLAPREPWTIKDPRLCFCLPLWLPLARDSVAVFVHRIPADVAKSLERRNGIPLSSGLDLWERYNRAALAATANIPCVSVSYEEVARNPSAAVAALHQRLSGLGVRGLRVLSAAETSERVQPSEKMPGTGACPLTAAQLALCEVLRSGGEVGHGVSAP